MPINYAETNVTDEKMETRSPEIRSAENLRVKQIKSQIAEAVLLRRFGSLSALP